LSNTASHHIAYLGYNFSGEAENRTKNNLGAMYIHSALDCENRRDGETVGNLRQLLSLKYAGDLALLKDLALAASWRQLNEQQVLNGAAGFANRDIDEQTWFLNAEKNFKIKRLELLLAYQFQQAKLNGLNARAGFIEQTLNAFFKFGNNAKFPTLFQQISSADRTAAASACPWAATPSSISPTSPRPP
jgi:hypothetical protein